MTKSFGSQIRGGESSFRLRISTHSVPSAGGALDVAVALNWDDFLRFGAELAASGRTILIYDTRTGISPDAVPLPGIRPAAVLAVRIDQMARDTVGHERAKNTVVLGLLAGWIGLPVESIRAGLRKKFQAKGAEVLTRNEQAFAAGLDYASRHPVAAATRSRRRSRHASRATSPTATKCALPRRLPPAAASSADIRSRRRARSCRSSVARSGNTAAPCCRPKTRSPRLAPSSARRSPGRNR